MALAEVPEIGASGETARIYSELRQELEVPLVTLVWRYLAVLPDVLSWAWATVRPVTGSLELRNGLNLALI
jgi:hypothetical protein